MIKLYANFNFPKEYRPEDYIGITGHGYNIGPSTLRGIIISTVVTIVEFWIRVHPEESRDGIIKETRKALSALETSIIIEEVIG